MTLWDAVWQWLLRAYPAQEPDETQWNLYHHILLDRRMWPEYAQGCDVLAVCRSRPNLNEN